MRILLLAQLILVLITSNVLFADQKKASEKAELVSYAQDIYRQSGINISRSAFDLKELETWGRVFFVNLVSRRSDLSEDLLQGFLTGGAVSQHARVPIDQIVIMVEIEFSREKIMILRAPASCTEELYNNRLSSDLFTQNCLKLDFRN